MKAAAVLDTNQWVSAGVQPKGNPARIVELGAQDRLRILTCEAIWDELTGVLQLPRLRKAHRLSDLELNNWLETMRQIAHWTPGEVIVDAVLADPDDNLVVACAVEGGADYIITGDQHLLTLESYASISIVTPSAFLEIWAED